jgi:hypothetical protein
VTEDDEDEVDRGGADTSSAEETSSEAEEEAVGVLAESGTPDPCRVRPPTVPAVQKTGGGAGMPLLFRKGRRRARRGNRGATLPSLQDESTEDKEGDEAEEAPVGVLAESGTPASGRGRPPTVPAEKKDEAGEELQDGGVTIRRRACSQHGGEDMWRRLEEVHQHGEALFLQLYGHVRHRAYDRYSFRMIQIIIEVATTEQMDHSTEEIKNAGAAIMDRFGNSVMQKGVERRTPVAMDWPACTEETEEDEGGKRPTQVHEQYMEGLQKDSETSEVTVMPGTCSTGKPKRRLASPSGPPKKRGA